MSPIGQKRNVGLWDECLPIPNLSRKVSVILVTVLSMVCYVVSVDGDFVFDDTEAVVNNKDIKLETPIHQIFYNDFWGTSMTHNLSHKSYRPLTILSFRVNLWLNNGVLSSFQFRLCNLLLHCIVCVLSINVFELLMGGNCPKAATLCAVLFSVHPIHTEAVAGVVGRAELLCALFSFISFISYNKAIYTTGYLGSFYYTLVSIFFASLSMFSKEQGITVLGINFVYEVWMVNNKKILLYLNEFYRSVRVFIKNLVYNNITLKKITVNNCDNNQNCTNFISLFITRFLLLFTIGLVLLYVRWKVMDGTPPIFQKVDNLAAFADSFIVRVVNYNYIYGVNTWILLCPIWLCFDWSMGCIPLITNVKDPRVITVIIFWFVVLLLILRCLKFNNEYSKTDRSIIMGLIFIVISFLPASNVFFKVGFVIAERVLYLPSVGYCIIIIISVHRFFNFLMNVSHRKSLYINITNVIFWLYVITTYSARSIQRSNDWRTESKLFQSALSVCPLNAKVHYNLGKVAVNKTLSIEYYKHAIRLNPEYDQAMNNLANILKDDGSLNEAEELLRKSIQLRPNFAAAWMNLGIVLSNKKQYSEAKFSYLEAIKFRKNYPDCYYNLGNLYLDQNHYAEANSSWRKAISQKPSHSIAWNNLIIMLDSIGKYEEAESTALEALFVLPRDAGIHFNLANTLGKRSQFEEAEKHFKIAIELNSNQALYYVNLGVLYHRWKKFKNAKDMYLKALEINPKLESAERNLKMLPEFK